MYWSGISSYQTDNNDGLYIYTDILKISKYLLIYLCLQYNRHPYFYPYCFILYAGKDILQGLRLHCVPVQNTTESSNSSNYTNVQSETKVECSNCVRNHFETAVTALFF